MGFTRAELLAHRDETVPDLIGPNCRLLFVGINPGLWTAATGAHFARPGNRFYPALARAGIVDRIIDASAGYTDADRDLLLARGIGITNIAPRATATAAELDADELRAGGASLRERVREIAPRVVAVAGITAYRTAFGLPKAKLGRQDIEGDQDEPQPDRSHWGGAQLWVVPNPSGLNAHETVDSLATAYRQVAAAAGLVGPSASDVG